MKLDDDKTLQYLLCFILTLSGGGISAIIIVVGRILGNNEILLPMDMIMITVIFGTIGFLIWFVVMISKNFIGRIEDKDWQ